MKLKIKIKRFTHIGKEVDMPKIISKGDWVDLRAAEDYPLKGPAKEFRKCSVVFDTALIPLGVAMQLPKGFEAHVLPRSSTYKNFGIILSNSQGVIDNKFQGNNDEWMFGAIALRPTTISFNDRIAQFRIELSQKATFWQKIKWLFCSGIEFVEVERLEGEDRKGIGSTGVK